MKYRQTDIQAQNSSRSDDHASLAGIHALNALHDLPRPVYGSAGSLANHAIPQWHSHAWAQLSHAAEGVIQVETLDGCFLVPPYRAVLIPADVEHAVQCSPLTVIRSLYIDPTVISADGKGCRVIEVTPLLRELICSFSELPVEYDEQGAEGRLTQVLVDQLIAAPVTNLMLPWPHDERLGTLCRALRDQSDNRDSLRQYSQRLDVSEKTLSRLFRQQTGLSFRQWRQRCRVLSALRPASRDAAHHAGAILTLLVRRFRQAWPEVTIVFRGDSGFCRPLILNWCDRHGVDYIIGIAGNKRLAKLALDIDAASAIRFEETWEKQRVFGFIEYAAGSWKKRRRKVIVKSETSQRGVNTRYVVTNLRGCSAELLYDHRYCARGEMENRIKEQQYLFSDRTSCHAWWPNQYRLLLSSLAYLLLERLRRIYLKRTAFAQAPRSTPFG